MYTAEISRGHPTALLFLIDQSGSMADSLSSGQSKAQQVADVLNRTLSTLIIRCTKAGGTRDYFEVGVIAYGGDRAYNGFQGALDSAVLHPISAVEAAPLRLEERLKKEPDGAGGLVDSRIRFAVWFEPQAVGGTPMRQAILQAATELVAWCDAHPDSFPPTVLHITDGESTDGDPEELAKQLCQIQTRDGPVMLFNLHVSGAGGQPVVFPAAETGLPDDYARLLFRMSSPLPEHLIRLARASGMPASAESRGFMFNADAVRIVEFFDIGTRAAQLR